MYGSSPSAESGSSLKQLLACSSWHDASRWEEPLSFQHDCWAIVLWKFMFFFVVHSFIFIIVPHNSNCICNATQLFHTLIILTRALVIVQPKNVPLHFSPLSYNKVPQKLKGPLQLLFTAKICPCILMAHSHSIRIGLKTFSCMLLLLIHIIYMKTLIVNFSQ